MAIRYYISTEEASFFNSNSMGYAANIPTTGTYKVGDFIISSKQEDGIFGWVCTVAGTPGEWEVIGSGLSGGNVDGGNKIIGYYNVVEFADARSNIEIGIDYYNKNEDFLEVHYNGLLLAEGIHYSISEDGRSINAIGGVWNENEDDTQAMMFRVLKSEGINVKKLSNVVEINNACYEVEIGIAEYNADKDLLEVHLNGVLLAEGIDYTVENGMLVKIDQSEAWNPYNVNGQKMFITVFKNNAIAIEPNDGSVTIDKLAPDVAENVRALDSLIDIVNIQNDNITNLINRVDEVEDKVENIEVEPVDISGKQDISDKNLVTTDKTVVGAINEVNDKADFCVTALGDGNQLLTNNKDNVVSAINELFQSANNGKELIASAIGEPVSADDTFSAMSTDINGLLSTFKANMMNNGVTVESSDKFKALIDKVATLVDSEGKGVQYTEGVFNVRANGNFYVADVELNFEPSIIILRTDYKYDSLTGTTNILYNAFESSDKYFVIDCYSSNKTVIENTLTQTGNKFTFSLNLGNHYTLSTNKYYAFGVGEEDTTLRDSLASILQEEGVNVTEEDDMVSLITKVDEEFNRQVVPAGDAVASNVLSGKTFINSTGQVVTGTMVNRGSKNITPTSTIQTLPAGYYSGINIKKANIVTSSDIVHLPVYTKSVTITLPFSNNFNNIWEDTKSVIPVSGLYVIKVDCPKNSFFYLYDLADNILILGSNIISSYEAWDGREEEIYLTSGMLLGFNGRANSSSDAVRQQITMTISAKVCFYDFD